MGQAFCEICGGADHVDVEFGSILMEKFSAELRYERKKGK